MKMDILGPSYGCLRKMYEHTEETQIFNNLSYKIHSYVQSYPFKNPIVIYLRKLSSPGTNYSTGTVNREPYFPACDILPVCYGMYVHVTPGDRLSKKGPQHVFRYPIGLGFILMYLQV